MSNEAHCLMLAAGEAGSLAGHFTWVDWAVVAGCLIFTTLLGGALAGKQATIRDFFLGGRKLPWYAVCGSIIATEISAVTFVGVPAVVYARGGNLTYLQLGLFGSIVARIIVGYVFVPAYYKREIYSPYDYMAGELGSQVRTMTTCLFTLGGMLAQGARVYLTAMVLQLILKEPLAAWEQTTGVSAMTWSIWLIGLVAIAWTIMGGITTVIWTDVILFLVFLVGAFVALGFVIAELPGGVWESVKHICTVGYQAKESGSWGKFTLFDFDFSPTAQYTIWTALIGNTLMCLAVFGTDQLLAQRMFCCRGPREARRAIIASGAGQIITVMMLLVGVGLFAYYREFPLTGEARTLVDDDKDRIFPVFIIQTLPPGVTGLLIASIFAAAISSLDSILAALSQTTISAFYLPWRQRRLNRESASPAAQMESDRSVVLVSRILVAFWGVMLCLMAHVADAASSKFPEILNLALSMAGYAGGALLAGFMLAFLKLKIDGRGFMWSGPLSVLLVFALVWHQPWTHAVCWAGVVALMLTWVWALRRQGLAVANLSELVREKRWSRVLIARDWWQTLVLMLGLAAMLWVNYYGYLDATTDEVTGAVKYTTVAWPWFVPIGTTVAFVFGYLLARRRERSPLPA